MSLAAFFGVALAHLMAAISPGPSFVLSVRTAISQGFRPAAALALGFGIGAAIWAFAALAGLTLLFTLMPPLFLVLKIGGGLFLIWLAVKMWRHASDPMPASSADASPRSMASGVRLGLATQIANPKPAIFFGAVFVGVMPVTATASDKAIVLANILWVETLWYVIVARAFSLPHPRAAYGRAKVWLDRGMGSILGLLGLKVALT
ncbi:LysE family translocator [Palleronia caenipelagi]|uniref:LysE family translocator n=1 Tax=Palleronia caenipelagi TaxID=2489174 RepID=A0A547QB42_9RHOB|nr:LysE family transporter [Palleronia caenipelagi]TRD23617.1 LysE family translocator [Palleronia caenipelagi]